METLHIIYLLLLHRSVSVVWLETRSEKKKKKEKQTDNFAILLLAPPSFTRKKMGGHTFTADRHTEDYTSSAGERKHQVWGGKKGKENGVETRWIFRRDLVEEGGPAAEAQKSFHPAVCGVCFWMRVGEMTGKKRKFENVWKTTFGKKYYVKGEITLMNNMMMIIEWSN